MPVISPGLREAVVFSMGLLDDLDVTSGVEGMLFFSVEVAVVVSLFAVLVVIPPVLEDVRAVVLIVVS